MLQSSNSSGPYLWCRVPAELELTLRPPLPPPQLQCKSWEGLLPLHCAALRGHRSLLELLLVGEAWVAGTAPWGSLPLSLAPAPSLSLDLNPLGVAAAAAAGEARKLPPAFPSGARLPCGCPHQQPRRHSSHLGGR